MMFYWCFAALTLLSLGLNVWQWLAARRFPLHQPVPPAPGLPSVTLLKPLHGSDEHTLICLRSWLVQDYPAPIQVLFGVKEAHDPVCEVVRRLIAEFPHRDAQLVICPETLGPNPKVSTLMQLEPLISGEAVVVSDADVEAPPHYLTEAMTLLQREGVGLVNSFYRLVNPRNHAMWLETIAVNCDFWSQVCQSNSIWPMKFALGAAMGLRLETLRQIGGFRSLIDFIADDNRLGRLVAGTGQRVVLTNVVVDCHHAPMNFRQVWDRQVRWARTIRACEPVPYGFSILANPLVWSLGWLLASVPLHSAGWSLIAVGGLALYASIRLATALAHFRNLNNHAAPTWKLVQLMDQKDVLSFVWWLSAFLGNTVTWHGRPYRILKEGRLAPLDGAVS